jgi:peroxiredoxin
MRHLVGRRLPDVALASTGGIVEMPARLRSRVVIFCYPWTGRPGLPNPPDWDQIPGAHGSTPQALAYSKAYEKFLTLDVKLFGANFQDTGWQQEFAARNRLTFPLLSDARREFADALGLPVFTTAGVDYLKRLTLVIHDGVIEAVRFPVAVPERDAEETLALVRESTP